MKNFFSSTATSSLQYMEASIDYYLPDTLRPSGGVYTTTSKRIQEKMSYQEFELLYRDLGEFASSNWCFQKTTGGNNTL